MPQFFNILSSRTTITSADFTQWQPDSWCRVSESSEFIGKTPEHVALVTGRTFLFGRASLCEKQDKPYVVLSEEAVRAVVDNAENQGDYIVGIYKLIHPDFDDIEQFNGWPRCGKKTWEYICRICQEKDRKLNEKRAFDKQVMPGGCWMNNGFTFDAEILGDWVVAPTDEKELVRRQPRQQETAV